ncbi:hypothetical protein H072_9728 [Dactylellina haptotyla CBS 200.50]|uniref:CFEM domain-containing protein n=1 Tax=Dactylellina haptotyla (strain CBS 200.50) TaxID=1284197 RepID=S8A152_DACHA|nr:hypothetical protein H072_9728 [Dactylellina haptotyla CBS 200.50]
MRISAYFALGLAALQGVSAVCNCEEIAATSLACDLNDAVCICGAGNFLDIVESCARVRRGERCSNRDLQNARNNFDQLCSTSSTTSAPSSTSEPTSTTSSSAPTTESTSESSTTESPTASTTSSTSSTSTMSPTNTAASSASSNKPVLTTAQIGGIAGGAAGLVVILVFLAVFCTFRKYKKIDKKEEVERHHEVEQFMEGGRQMRAASMSHMSDRLYSTNRPLSHALGEYDSTRYDAEEENDISAQSSISGGSYFNRFSGNHLEDSTQAFSNTSPQGYFPPSSYRNSQRAVSVPSGPGGPMLPTASLSYEEYRNQAYESSGERSYLMSDQGQMASSAPHRSVSAPMPNQARISRKPIGNSVNERNSQGSYHY